MFTHLLVPLDGSSLAEEALDVASEIAEKFDSTITLLHVLIDIPHASLIESESHDDLLDKIRRTAYEQAVTFLGEAGRKLREKGLTRVYQHIIEDSSPADAILTASGTLAADGIVMSTHGRAGFNRWVFGSVAERVLRGSKIPIVLIRGQ